MTALSASKGATLDVILSRLDGVKAYGSGYRARCPSCGGRSQKLSITEADQGRLLLHCFGGCEAAVVVQAMGLQLADLFPARLADQSPAERRESRRRLQEAGWGAALEVLAFEATIVLFAARQLARREPLSGEDHRRLMDGIRRIADAQRVLRNRKDTWRPHVR